MAKIQPDIGASAEYLFASECLRRGLIPLWPSTQTRPYDLVVDTGLNRIRVQVKGSETKGKPALVNFVKRTRKLTRKYTSTDIDFLVVYLFGYDCWYIFPVESIAASAWLNPNDLRSKHKKYKDAWYLLTNK